MATWKIVLFSILGAILLFGVIGMVVGRTIKKRRQPDYVPTLTTKEKILCYSSAGLGVILIVLGIVIPKFAVDDTQAGMPEGLPEGEEFYESGDSAGSVEGGVVEAGDGVVVVEKGGSVRVG